MTSIVGHTLHLEKDAPLPYWAKVDWSPEIEHDIYRDWGTYYFNRRRENFAMHYYTKALEMDDGDFMTLYRRSQTQRKAARIEGALNDATKASVMALKKRGASCPINLQICDALFELNQFENCNKELHDNMRVFIGVKAKTFEKRLVVVDDVIKDVTGKAMSLFFLRNQKLIRHVSELTKAKAIVDKRILWKKLRDQKKCDVVSILETEEEILPPIEIARRKRAFNVVHQTYMNDSWYDILFMKNLRKNPSLLLPQCKRSNSFVESLVNKQYDIVRQFMKMLQCRNPLYYVSFLKYPNKKMLEKNKEANLFRVQYQTFRNMIADLKHIRLLRKEKRITTLCDYVEKVMGDYYVTKRNRVMCWKFEFINEVYNTLALALCDQFVVPKSFRHATMARLLHLSKDSFKDIVPFVFGDRSTYQQGDDQDLEGKRARRLLVRMDRRIRFAKYSIEKCYLYHKMAMIQLSQLHYDECCFNARRAIKESQNCNSLIWRFLSVMQITKANVAQHKLERTRESLEEAAPVATLLRSQKLIKFIEACTSANDEEYHRKQNSIASQRSSKASVLTDMSRSRSDAELDMNEPEVLYKIV
ncbi:uncharacterized protein LOC133843170 [Drosophila sulfurigaster albostrigata]|uniref:uncharacterized protein LOC133843170 n=1 Tax=Drosophila sulfurigaster albostrigata TaxID=89887 RepID=UPI002D21C24B|nr:uncharacterized protein LOC133843170 [Drosophila sulfurigaster albostrigata]